MRVSKLIGDRNFLIFTSLFFFFNNFMLPHGLLYTTILTPLFIYWLYLNGRTLQIALWSMLLLIPVPFQFMLDIDIKVYIISSGLFFTAWIFLFTAIEAVKQQRDNLEEVFRFILTANLILVLIASAGLVLGLGKTVFWDSDRITDFVEEFPRLKLLGYEPSHYALILAPIFLFFILRIITGLEKKWLFSGIAVVLPLILSLSFGTIGWIAVAVILAIIISYRNLPKITIVCLFYGTAGLLALFLITMLIWPDNAVYVRISNIISGNDTSINGRTEWSFKYAVAFVFYFKAWFGIGPGQVKILLHELIDTLFHSIPPGIVINYRIPNSMAEMLATYGFYGFFLKLGTEIYFFIRKNVYKNLYALTLFLFIFFYQFTGSFIINVAELGIWVLVFHSRFEQFNLSTLRMKI